MKKGGLLKHKEYGRGVVVKVLGTMYADVLFGDGNWTLAHQGW